MTYTSIAKTLTNLAAKAIKSSRLIALAIVASFTLAAMQPAQAQSADTWKSIAIIGGSTAAGAYIGHKVGGSTGAWVGAAAGASTGYAIDRRRRANESYNQDAYNNGGYYPNDGGYYGDNSGYYGNGGYNGGPYDNGAYPYPSGYQNNNYYRNSSRLSNRR
jgi:hypothetical protein